MVVLRREEVGGVLFLNERHRGDGGHDCYPRQTADSSTPLRSGRNDNQKGRGQIGYVMPLVAKREDAGERDANPRGAVVEFVEQLVERLLQKIGVQTQLSLLPLRDEGWVGRVDGELVGAEELGGDGVLPEGEPGR